VIGPSFVWFIDGHAIRFEWHPSEGVYRPVSTNLIALVWPYEHGYRAALDNSQLAYLSRPRALPQDALRDCASFFKRIVNAQ
jgi:hypothetical protein